jgi:uncharacterized protein (DUF697 family)
MNVSSLFRRGPPARLCRERARSLVHKYAAAGTVWALLPVPMATSAGLALLETHLIYWVARIYGEHPTKSDVVMTAAGLNLASVALKTAAIEGAALVPAVGLGIKASIAGSVVEALGHAIVLHYEGKYPERLAAEAETHAEPGLS